MTTGEPAEPLPPARRASRFANLRFVRAVASLTPRGLARLAFAVAALLLTVAATVVAFLVSNDGMMHNSMGNDEGFFVWCGWCILKGLTPYRDFMEFKPPLVFLTHALALKLHGLQNFQYRWFFLYFPLASIVAVQLALVTRRVDKLIAMAFSLALVNVWVNPHFHDTALSDSESIGLTYYFFGVAFLVARTPFPAWTQAFGGAFLTCCIFSKEPYVPCVGLTWICGFLVNDRPRNLREGAVRYAKFTGIGAAIVVAGLCAYLAPTGGLKAYLAIASRYSVVYRDPAQSYCVLLHEFEPTTSLNDLVRFYSRARREYVNLSTLGVLVPFAIVYVVCTGRRSLTLLVATALTGAAAVYGVSISNCPWHHYYNIAIGGLFFCALVGVDSLTPYLRGAEPWTRTVVRLVLVGVTVAHVWPTLDAERDSFGQRGFPAQLKDTVDGSLQTVREHTSPTDRVFTTGNPAFYVVADRLSAVRESTILDEILPFYRGSTDAERLRPMYDELVKNRPKVVVLDPEYGSRKGRHQKALLDPFLQEFHYREVKPHVFLRPD